MYFKHLVFACLVVLSLSIIPNSVFSQEKSLTQLVDETIQLRRQNNYWKGLSPFRAFIKDSAQAMIQTFSPFITDSMENVRSLSYRAIAITGQKNTESQVRQRAVSVLINACTDTDASIRKNIAAQLENYRKEDFSIGAKQKLAALLQKEPTYFRNIIKLIGFLEMKEQIPILKNLLHSEKAKNKTLKWDIRLTLARLEDQQSIHYCVDFVRNVGLNDKVIYNLFPDLTYMRVKEASDYMIEVLYKDSKDCFSPNPDNPAKILCAYRVMEYLAPIIVNFPLTVDKDGELDIDDYTKGLQTCRRWFKENVDYELDRSRF